MSSRPIIRVNDVMDTNVVIVERLLTAQEALHTMKEKKLLH